MTIKDNGVGIAPADHERIFRMFERAVGRGIPGTGIGLAIVKKAVERMGGAVGLASEPGAGSEFWIELPAAEDAAAPETAETGGSLVWRPLAEDWPRAIAAVP